MNETKLQIYEFSKISSWNDIKMRIKSNNTVMELVSHKKMYLQFKKKINSVWRVFFFQFQISCFIDCDKETPFTLCVTVKVSTTLSYENLIECIQYSGIYNRCRDISSQIEIFECMYMCNVCKVEKTHNNNKKNTKLKSKSTFFGEKKRNELSRQWLSLSVITDAIRMSYMFEERRFAFLFFSSPVRFVKRLTDVRLCQFRYILFI